MQQLLHVVHQWSLSHCLAVNSSKNYAIYFSPSVRAMTMVKVTLYLGNSVLTTADTITILGVLFSHDVSWSSHVTRVYGKKSAASLVSNTALWHITEYRLSTKNLPSNHSASHFILHVSMGD